MSVATFRASVCEIFTGAKRGEGLYCIENIICSFVVKLIMTRIERVTIRDIPLERAPFSRIPKDTPAQKVSERQWMLLRIGGAVLILLGLSLASNIVDPSISGALAYASNGINTGIIAGIFGMALIIAIAASSIISHEDE